MLASLKILEKPPKVLLNEPYASLNYLLQSSSSSLSSSSDLKSIVNASSTLPYPVKTTPSMGLFAKGKQFLILYKKGIVNVFKNHRKSRQILKSFTHFSGSKTLAKRVATVDSITQSVLDMAAADRIKSDHELESTISKTSESSENTIVNYPDISCSLNRADYQLLIRTPPDVRKIPLFSVVFCVFFETTPLLVYLFPSIVPKTCVLPGQTKKAQKKTEALIWKARSIPVLEQENVGTSTSNPLSSTKSYPVSSIVNTTSAYRLPRSHLEHLSVALGLFSKLIPVSILPQQTLANAVDRHVSRLKADSYLLSWARDKTCSDESPANTTLETTTDFGAAVNATRSDNTTDDGNKSELETETHTNKVEISGSGIWSLNHQELIKTCQERLIPLTLDEKASVAKSEKHLRMDLFYWTVGFIEDKGDAGFLFNTPVSYAQNETQVEGFYNSQAHINNLEAPIF